MPNKLVTFKHLTGSLKPIPGVSDRVTQPAIKAGIGRSPELHVRVRDFAVGTFPVCVEDKSYTPSIVLVDETYQDLTAEEKKLPKALRDRLEVQRAEDVLARRDANRRVMDVLRKYEMQREIEIVNIEDMTPQEVVNTRHPIVSLSEIAIADHNDRNQPIPPELMNNKIDTERERARAALS